MTGADIHFYFGARRGYRGDRLPPACCRDPASRAAHSGTGRLAVSP